MTGHEPIGLTARLAVNPKLYGICVHHTVKLLRAAAQLSFFVRARILLVLLAFYEQTLHLDFLKCTLGVKRSAPNWAVLRECAHKPLQFYWFRAAIRFYNRLLSSKSATLKQARHADLKLVLWAITSLASDILRAFEGLRGCDTYAQAFLQGLHICYSDFTADVTV